MSVEVELRITLKKCRDVVGESKIKREQIRFLNGEKPHQLEVSIPEAEARELWTQIGLKLRGVNKDA